MAEKNKTDNNKPVRKTGKGAIANWREPDVKDGDNANFLSVSMKLFNLPKVDLHNPDEVEDRLNQYFQIYYEADLKPTVAGMAMALGVDRRRLWEIRTGNYNTQKEIANLPTSVKDLVKKAYFILENQWESYMQQGKINPVSGIFLGKNNFGYRDQQEMVLTPNTNNEPDYDVEAIKKRLSAPDVVVVDGESSEE